MYEIFACTDIGRIREQNEDGFVVNHYFSHQGSYQVTAEDFLVAVADGMGGAQGGRMASHIALKNCSEIPFSIGEDELKRYIGEHIHQEIHNYGKEYLQSAGLGTTLTGFISYKDRITIFHVGDTRLYRLRDGFLKQLTSDHTLVETLLSMGKISREEMKKHPDRHVLLHCLGGGEKNQSIQPDVQSLRFPTEPEDVFILCSDGLSGLLSHEEMEKTIKLGYDLPDTVKRLIAIANGRGGPDNITVIAVKRMM